MSDDGDDDWFGDASPSLGDKTYEAHKARIVERVRRGIGTDPNVVKAAVQAFEAVEKGAPILGTHPGYAGAGVKPTIGDRRGGEHAPRPGSDGRTLDPKDYIHLTTPEVIEGILKAIQEERPEDQRQAASQWLTLVTRAISDFTRSLDDESLDEEPEE